MDKQRKSISLCSGCDYCDYCYDRYSRNDEVIQLSGADRRHSFRGVLNSMTRSSRVVREYLTGLQPTHSFF
jgi:hypothetical protein